MGDIMNSKKNIKKSYKRTILDTRFNILLLITVFIFFLIGIKLIQVTLIDSSIYTEELEKLTERLVAGDRAPRGRIYDRNYNILVDNIAIPVIYYQNDSNISVAKKIEKAYLIAEKLAIDYKNISEYTLKDFIIATNPDYANSLISENERELQKHRQLTDTDIYYLKLNRITKEDLENLKEIDKETAQIYHLMNTGYSYEDKVIKKEDITDSEIAYIAENADELEGFNIKYDWKRIYTYGDAFRSILGNVGSIAKENKDFYLVNGYTLDDIVGVSYIEKQYEEILKGEKNTYRLISNNKAISNKEGKRGNDIVLTIDINLQKEIEQILDEEIIKTKNDPSTEYFNHIYVVIQEPNTGEILAMAGRQMLKENDKYKSYDITPGVVTSPVTPGSIVKAASMLVGYNTSAISIGEYQTDSCIKIYSKPQKCSWMSLGRINDIDALKNSSNIYQFKIAMEVAGFNYYYNAPFNVDTTNAFKIYRDTFNQLGLGTKTEIDLPVESIGNIGTNISPDLLLNFTIGQYDTYTTMQLSQYINTIASDGNRYKPQLLKKVHSSSQTADIGDITYEMKPIILNKVITEDKYIKRVQEGLKRVVLDGTGAGIMGSVKEPAGKTGTSESFIDTNEDGKIDAPTLSNAFVGYAPYSDPKMSIAIVFPNLVNSKSKTNLRSYAQYRITRRVSEKFFELYK